MVFDIDVLPSLSIDMQRTSCQRWSLRVGKSFYIFAVNPRSLKQTQNTFMFLASLCSECTLEDSKHPDPNCSKYHLLVLSRHSSVHMTQ